MMPRYFFSIMDFSIFGAAHPQANLVGDGGKLRKAKSVTDGCTRAARQLSPAADISARIGLGSFGRVGPGNFTLACRNPVPTFPQRSPPSLLTTAACSGLRSAPDCRPRRTPLHLSYSCPTPFGPELLVAQYHERSKRMMSPAAGKCAM